MWRANSRQFCRKFSQLHKDSAGYCFFFVFVFSTAEMYNWLYNWLARHLLRFRGVGGAHGTPVATSTRQGRPRTSREVALARTRVQRRRPRVFGHTFATVRHKTPARSVSDRPARADRVARVILEPRASSDEHRIVITSPVPRRFRTMQRHAFVPVAH